MDNLSEILGADEMEIVMKEHEVKDIVNNYPAFLQGDYENGYQNQQSHFYLNSHELVVKVENDVKPDVIPSVISTDEYSGPYNFDVFIDPHRNAKWVYSSLLRKIFIPVRHSFPIDFKWDITDLDLFIKATPLFCCSQFSQDLVTTCIPHSLETDPANKNMPKHVWRHILRCVNAEAMYEGGQHEGKHLSVTVPLGRPQSGTETVRQIYQFVCKNSCPTGMNRKAVQIVFTLEDVQGSIFGRKSIEIRACSCPKRDKEKEEDSAGKEGQAVSRGKKRKMDKKFPASKNDDSDVVTLTLPVVGKENAKAVLKFTHDLMCAEAYRKGDDQRYKKCIGDIKDMMSKP